MEADDNLKDLIEKETALLISLRQQYRDGVSIESIGDRGWLDEQATLVYYVLDMHDYGDDWKQKAIAVLQTCIRRIESYEGDPKPLSRERWDKTEDRKCSDFTDRYKSHCQHRQKSKKEPLSFPQFLEAHELAVLKAQEHLDSQQVYLGVTQQRRYRKYRCMKMTPGQTTPRHVNKRHWCYSDLRDMADENIDAMIREMDSQAS